MEDHSEKSYDSVREWLDNASDLNAPDEGGLFLIRAILGSGNTTLLKEAIDKNINLNQDTGEGWTALHDAIASAVDSMIQNNRQSPYPNLIEMVKMLLDSGADLSVRDAEGRAPLDWLSAYNDIDFFNELKEFLRPLIPDIDDRVQFNRDAADSKPGPPGRETAC